MDTLIDKREFPKEMHQQEDPKSNLHKPNLLVLLVVVALAIIVFLSYNIFLKKDLGTEEKQTYTQEEQREVVDNFKNTAVNSGLSEQRRQDKINVFFNKN